MNPKPPALSLTASEFARSGNETARLLLGMRSLLAESHASDGHPVLTVPGYGADDAAMATLRFFLRRLGYRVHSLRLGRNFEGRSNRIQSMDDAAAFRAEMVEGVVARIAEIEASRGERVSLIGWSMGGLYAFDAANRVPDLTRMVITLGSPYGDPRGTPLFGLLRWLNGGTQPIEEQNFAAWNDMAAVDDHEVPVRVFYSERDGIVSTDIAKPAPHPTVECIEIDSSHVGFAMNPKVFRAVARELAASGGGGSEHPNPGEATERRRPSPVGPIAELRSRGA